MNISEKLTSALTILLLLTQVVLSTFILQRLNGVNQAAVAGGTDSSAPAFVENVSLDDDPTLGVEGAPITIVAFSDYECPFCKSAVANIDAILKDYPQEVHYVLRDFPLGHIHAHAAKAAQAANCAGDQGKYWEMHDLLFERQGQFDTIEFVDLANELQLDSEQFSTCLDSEKYEEEVVHDAQQGREYQVEGTPTYFVNGKRMLGPSYEDLKQEIEAQLQEIAQVN